MRLFNLIRHQDESGVSGTGNVAQGCLFDNGKVAMTWLSDKTDVDASSTTIYDSIDDVLKIHGHDGKTTIEYKNGEKMLEADN